MAESTLNFYQRPGSIPFTNDDQCLLNQAPMLPPRTSSWFRRPARISKHASRESSPRGLVRRRTTALVHAPTRQKSITGGTGHQKHFSTPNSVVSLEKRGRPMSWHSTGLTQAETLFQPSTTQLQSDVSSSYLLDPTFSAAEVNGAITPLTQRAMGEPFIQDIFTPLNGLSSQDFENRYAFLNEFSAERDPFYESQCNTQYGLPNEPCYQFSNGLYEFPKQPEYYVSPFEATAPPTPDIAPHQTSARFYSEESLSAVEHAGTDDLIGMGLYDAPSPTPAAMSFLSGPWDLPIRPSPGKGLKLEETFQPAPADDEESETCQGEDEEEEEPTFRHTPDMPISYLGFEEKGSYYEQNSFGGLHSASDFSDGQNSYWSTGSTAQYGWDWRASEYSGAGRGWP